MTTGLLTEIASHDEPGSWGRASVGWPKFPDDVAEDMYVFANLNRPIPYGSYVRMADCLRVHPSYHGTLAVAFEQAGKPSASESIAKARSAPVQAPAATIPAGWTVAAYRNPLGGEKPAMRLTAPDGRSDLFGSFAGETLVRDFLMDTLGIRRDG